MSFGINMDYCQFENTYKALQQCLETMGTEDKSLFLEMLSRSEKYYMYKISDMLEDFVEELEAIDDNA